MKRTVSLLISLFLVLSLVACAPQPTSEPTGTPEVQATPEPTPAPVEEKIASATARGFGGEVSVSITVAGDTITEISITGDQETAGIGSIAVDTLGEKMLEQNSVEIDGVSGATVTSTAILAAAKDALAQTGSALAGSASGDTGNQAATYNVDVAVIGSGAAGTSAALAAAESGASVLVLEKLAMWGGSGAMAGGLFAVESKQQADAGVTVTKEFLFKKMIDFTHQLADYNLVSNILDKSASTIEWLEGYGVELVLSMNPTYAGVHTIHSYKDRATTSSVYYKNLYDNLAAMGGELLLETKATELIVSADGAVTGVLAEKADGTAVTVNAKNVIVATGGYGADTNLMMEYAGIENYFHRGSAGNTGDGIQMAWAAGADEHGLGVVQSRAPVFESENGAGFTAEELGGIASCPGLIWIDNQSMRFADESCVTDLDAWGANIQKVIGNRFYIVFDQASLDGMVSNGFDAIGGQARSSAIPNDQPLTKIVAEMNAGIDAGFIYKSDSLNGLAEAMGIDATILTQTFEKYNNACAEGQDYFYKDAKYLHAVETAPFYAVEYEMSNLGTMGGVRVNANLQALRADGSIISGLYVAGNDVGGMYGDMYYTIEGATLGFAYNSGRLAGEHATGK